MMIRRGFDDQLFQRSPDRDGLARAGGDAVGLPVRYAVIQHQGWRTIPKRSQHVDVLEVAINPVEPLSEFRVWIDSADGGTKVVAERCKVAMAIRGIS